MTRFLKCLVLICMKEICEIWSNCENMAVWPKTQLSKKAGKFFKWPYILFLRSAIGGRGLMPFFPVVERFWLRILGQSISVCGETEFQVWFRIETFFETFPPSWAFQECLHMSVCHSLLLKPLYGRQRLSNLVDIFIILAPLHSRSLAYQSSEPQFP